jgi:hypothetical protein
LLFGSEEESMRRISWKVLLVALAGCEGLIGDASPADIDRPIVPIVPTPETCEGVIAVGETPLRRLTRAQYRNTLEDVIGLDSLPAAAEDALVNVPDGQVAGFASTTTAPSPEDMRAYLSIAEEVAPLVVRDRFSSFVSCSMEDPACTRAFLEAFGRRLYRRALVIGGEDDEIAPYEAIVDEFRADGVEIALETAVTAMLASPKFLYHAEPIADLRTGGTVAIDAFALASRLSYFLWQSAPDDALLDAAESGALSTPDRLEAEARRLLDDPRSERGMKGFYTEWLHLSGLGSLTRDDPAFTPSLLDAMREEALAFVESVMTEGDGTLRTLLTASYTIGNDELAALYGAPAPGDDGRIELDPDERAGLLTQAGFLAETGTIFPEVHRGKWVRTSLLCDSPPPPPADVPQEGFATRLSTEPCRTCHERMDPIGFGFADYDDLGRFRPLDAETRASLPQTEIRSPDGKLGPELVGEFDGPRELAERLAESDQVGACVSRQWASYATGRRETATDACNRLELADAFAASGGDLRELMFHIATSHSFASRSTTEIE